ncbi:MAG TPA: PIN domain-containing protein [Gemmatimonadales bacterium]
MDTGAWLAAFHRRDQYHAAAAGTLRRLRAERTRLVVTNLIVAELHRHLLYALGPARAAMHVHTLVSDALIDQVFADERLQAAAFTDWIHGFPDQAFTLTDAVSFAAMRAHGMEAAFTYDRHYAIAGFATLGL